MTIVLVLPGPVYPKWRGNRGVVNIRQIRAIFWARCSSDLTRRKVQWHSSVAFSNESTCCTVNGVGQSAESLKQGSALKKIWVGTSPSGLTESLIAFTAIWSNSSVLGSEAFLKKNYKCMATWCVVALKDCHTVGSFNMNGFSRMWSMSELVWTTFLKNFFSASGTMLSAGPVGRSCFLNVSKKERHERETYFACDLHESF